MRQKKAVNEFAWIGLNNRPIIMRLPINEGKNRIFAKQADIFLLRGNKKERERESFFVSNRLRTQVFITLEKGNVEYD